MDYVFHSTAPGYNTCYLEYPPGNQLCKLWSLLRTTIEKKYWAMPTVDKWCNINYKDQGKDPWINQGP